MGYHHCPIEPSDWSDGPDDYHGEECHNCEGTGEEIDDNGDERTCSACDGSGYIDAPYFDDDVI